MRNEVYETLNKLDSQGGVDAYVYENGDKEGEQILVVYGWDDVRKLEWEFVKLFETDPEFNKRNNDEYNHDALDYATEGDWTFSDEGFTCSECNKWHFYNSHGACGYRNYFAGDGYILCEDCVKADPEEYLATLINEPEAANTMLDLGDLGFKRVNDWPYANGWYGREENPTKIMKQAMETAPDAEFVFNIRKNYNPFETEFDLYKREVV